MNKIISPSFVDGNIIAPASKSLAQRAIAVASITKGFSEIFNPGMSEDVTSCINISRALGANIEEEANKLVIEGGIHYPSSPLNCGESGLSIRMFSAIAATFDREITLTGTGSLTQRPMNALEQSLSNIGVHCKTNNGKLPVLVRGPFVGGKYFIDGTEGSQVLTGILIASSLVKNDLHLVVNNLKSKPYIDLTLEVISSFGIKVENNDHKEFFIKSGQLYKPCSFRVEGDWSGAAFFLVAGAIAGRVVVQNLSPNSHQADKVILEALSLCGAQVSIAENSVEVSRNNLSGFEFDATNCPDLFPPLVALASHCKGKTAIKGIERLRGKESNRSLTLQSEFSKLGITILLQNDVMIVEGSPLKSGKVDSCGDHRIAMACAVAALGGNGNVSIERPEVVSKSYPNFFEDMESITKTNINHSI